MPSSACFYPGLNSEVICEELAINCDFVCSARGIAYICSCEDKRFWTRTTKGR